MRGCSWPLPCPSTILAYSCYSSQFVAFCHISRLSLPFSLSKSRILLNLLFLIFLPYLLLNLFTYRKNSCYFAIFVKFADLLKPFLTFSLSKCRILWNLLFLLFLPYLLLNLFHKGRKILVTFAIFAKFVDISKPFLTFSFF